jgi:drug/metabolite transporter (DMT)-like permease
MAARRGPVFGVVLVAQLVGMALAFVFAVGRAEPLPDLEDVGWAVVAGIAGSIGLTSLYHGLATGRMSTVAPLTGVLAAAFPVVVGWGLQGAPAALQVAGIGLAIVAVLLVSTSADPHSDRPSGLRWGLLAGVGFGLFNVFASRFGEGSVFGPLVVVRLVEAAFVALIIVVTRRPWRLRRPVVGLAAAVGVGDMGGNAFFILAAQAGRLDIAGVLSSLYPVTTVVLATVLLHERVTRSHAFGIVLAGVAIALIALG